MTDQNIPPLNTDKIKSKQLHVDLVIHHVTDLPKPDSTPEERLQALKDAKELLLTGGPGEGGVAGALFGKSSPNKGGDQYPDPMPMFRVAEYITTGHDYLDTHPQDVHIPVEKKKSKKK